MAHPRNRGDSSIRLSRPVRKVRGPETKVVQNGPSWPSHVQSGRPLVSKLAKIWRPKTCQRHHDSGLFVGDKVAAMLPDKIFSLRWRHAQMANQPTTKVKEGALSLAFRNTTSNRPFKVEVLKIMGAKRAQKNVRIS